MARASIRLVLLMARASTRTRQVSTLLEVDPSKKIEANDDEGLRHSQWRDQFQQLCEYKVQFDHCLVSNKYAANPMLGGWVSKQRTRYKLHQEGKPSPMTEEHIRALESIGFDWGKTKTDWIARFQQLREYKIQFGHCLVPNQYSANPKLGNWVSTQRSTYRLHQEGKPSNMPEERIRELESIGFDWGKTKTDCGHPFGAYDFNNCASTRYCAATASCQTSTLQTPSSGIGFRLSAATTGYTRKESQVA